ncbi:MAG TPA: alpha/beta hydrolase, partial [Candidatus Bathyarchaeia archaeon]|nr:alpha/beta hydrolase [Candidatus Bathyarchaeia archaeon]
MISPAHVDEHRSEDHQVPEPATGYFRNGLPYSRAGSGPRTLVVFEGQAFENKPMPSLMVAGLYRFLEQDYTIYSVNRKPGLPSGYTMQNMADDYATMIREEFGGPVDVIGVSTGGSIAQHVAADLPDLVRKLVLHSTAHTLGEAGKAVQWRIGELVRQGRRREVCTTMLGLMLPSAGIKRDVGRLAVWVAGFIMPLILPKDLSDLAITIEAEDKLHFKDRLSEITASTLVVAGDKDPFYSETLFRETAEGIPNARLILYQGMGHPAHGKHFRQDVLAFLKEDSARPQILLQSSQPLQEQTHAT